MASRKTLLVAAAMALVATAALLPATESKNTTFTVGDHAGWDVGVDYKAWTRGKKFKAGDTLVFRKKHGKDVAQVDKQSFHDCSMPRNARVLGKGFDVVDVVLGETGKFFFICNAKGACESGMKLAINAH